MPFSSDRRPHNAHVSLTMFVILGSFHLPLLFPFIAQPSGRPVGLYTQQMRNDDRLFTFCK